jgi:hypothetical protein
MTDNELEDLLRRVRPAGPRPELRARIVASTAARRGKRAWPWAMAAAAMLILTVVLQFSTAQMNRETARVVSAMEADVDDLAALRIALDGNELLIRQAELWTLQRQRSALRPESDPR